MVEKIINDVLIVGDENVIRDLFYPDALGRKGRRRVRALLAPGGGKSGHTMGSRLIAFEEAGITANHFDAGHATSAGSYNIVGYCAGQTALIPHMYSEISWLNPHVLQSVLWRHDYLGLMYLEDRLRKTLDVEAFKRSKMDLTIGVSDLHANPILYKAKEVDDVFDLMFASSSLFPVVPARKIGGIPCVDGGFTVRSSTLAWARRARRELPRHHPIDLLYIANRPHPRYEDPTEEMIFRWLARMFMHNHPELRRGALSIAGKLRKVASIFQHQLPTQRRCAIFPLTDENIYPNEWNAYRLKVRGELTRKRTDALLKALKPARHV